MTSEVMLLNNNLIVLSADSALTITDSKVFNGHQKVFILSQKPPMGMMIYGTANIVGLPTYAIVSEYKKQADFEKNNTLTSISEDLFSFIKNKSIEYKKDSFEDLEKSIKETCKSLEDKFKTQRELPIKVLNDMPVDPNLSLYDLFKKNNLIDKIDKNLFDNILNKHFKEYENKEGIIDVILKIALSDFRGTGVVIAGFSENDLYPSFGHYKIYGVFNKKLLYTKLESKLNTEDSLIMPFAQKKAINNLIFGLDIDFLEDILKSITDSFNLNFKNIENLVENVSLNDEDKNKFKKELFKLKKTHEKIMDETFEDIMDNIRFNYYSSILSIGSMSSDDALETSNGFIELGILNSRLKDIVQSVGGKVCSLLITRDGINFLN